MTSKPKLAKKIEFKDREAVDFGWYFSNEYQVILPKKKKRKPTDQEEKTIHWGGEVPLAALSDSSEIVGKCYEYVKNYIKEQLEKKEEIPVYEVSQTHMFHMAQIVSKQNPE